MNFSHFSHTALKSNSIATVIALDSELIRGTETQVVTELLPRVTQESIALNLSKVERMDAAGIAALLSLYCASVEAGTDFSIVAPSENVLSMLRTVGLDVILTSGSRHANHTERCLECPAA